MSAILVDVPNVLHRYFYALQPMFAHGDRQAAVRVEAIYGFLREVSKIVNQQNPERIAFCFDEGRSRRREILPYYKDKVKASGTRFLDTRNKKHYRSQEKLLKSLLAEIGFSNVLSAHGYEADDVIGSLCQSHRKKRLTIVSTDKDFYQLLRHKRVEVYNHSKGTFYTAGMFCNDWPKLGPDDWVEVKAIAGCKSDMIPGIKGFGEITAAKLLVDMKNYAEDGMSKAYRKFIDGEATYRRNLKLVALPFEGTPSFKLKRDVVTPRRWKAALDAFGLPDLETAYGEVK